jgi:hypothetical protein
MRALRLRKETLTELTAEDLTLVVGAMQEITKYCGSDFAPCFPTYRCPTNDCTQSLQSC